jgi:hypothetical protein
LVSGKTSSGSAILFLCSKFSAGTGFTWLGARTNKETPLPSHPISTPPIGLFPASPFLPLVSSSMLCLTGVQGITPYENFLTYGYSGNQYSKKHIREKKFKTGVYDKGLYYVKDRQTWVTLRGIPVKNFSDLCLCL